MDRRNESGDDKKGVLAPETPDAIMELARDLQAGLGELLAVCLAAGIGKPGVLLRKNGLGQGLDLAVEAATGKALRIDGDEELTGIDMAPVIFHEARHLRA